MTPIPEPDDYPEGDADTVLEYARSVDSYLAAAGSTGIYQSAVASALDLVRSMLGKPEIAEALTYSWADCIVPGQLVKDLTEAKNDAEPYWQGPAHEAFIGYFRDVATTLRDTQSKIGSVAKELTNTITYVYDQYGDAVKHITDAAGYLVNAVWPPDWAALLGDLVSKIGEIYDKAIDRIGEYRASVARIHTDLAQLEWPVTVPQSVGDYELWEVQPVPENPPPPPPDDSDDSGERRPPDQADPEYDSDPYVPGDPSYVRT